MVKLHAASWGSLSNLKSILVGELSCNYLQFSIRGLVVVTGLLTETANFQLSRKNQCFLSP